MKPGKKLRIVKDIVTSKNPAEATGKAARAALTATHPFIGIVAGKAVEKGVEKAVNKGIEIAKDPVVQEKAKALGKKVVQKGTQAAQAGARATRRGAGAAVKKLQSFREGRGQ